MKLAVVGSRTWKDWIAVLKTIHELKPTLVISGGAAGADNMGRDAARRLNIPVEIHYPQWAVYGKRAGAIRNAKIVERCDKLVAFWDGESKGTKISIDMAEKAGKLLKVIHG